MTEHGRRAQLGQVAVELAVMIPVVIVVALVVYNLCRFVEACAAFDRAAPTAVIAQGVAPAGERDSRASAQAVRTSIEAALSMPACEVSVEVSGVQAVSADEALTFPMAPLLTTYTCTLRYRPWPSSFVVAGVPFAPPVALVHEQRLVVDRSRPEVVA